MLLAPADIIIKSIRGIFLLLLLLFIYYLVNIGNKFVDEDKQISISNKNIVILVIAIITSYALYRLFKNNPFLSDLLSTIIVSIILAYAINPIINYLEKRKIARGKAVLIVYIAIIAIVIILGVSVIPKAVREIKNLAVNFPAYVDELLRMIENFTNNLSGVAGELPPPLKGIEDTVEGSIKELEVILGNSIKSFIVSFVNLISKAVSIVLTPILIYYFVVDKDNFKNIIIKLIPDNYEEDVIELAKIIDSSLILFIRGRLIMSIYIAIATTFLLLFMRIEFAIVIGIITGLFDIVPYIGPFLGYLPAVFFGALSSPVKALWISIFFVGIQWVENNILAPKIIGDNMGLHPMIILLSIIVGGGVFGVFGMILSVPVVATVKIIIEFLIKKRKEAFQK